MTREEIIKVAGMVYDVGESTEHFISMDYSSKYSESTVTVFKKEYGGWAGGIVDSITIKEFDEEAQAFFTRWTERIRKERVLNGTH